jgi:hypothetical protein
VAPEATAVCAGSRGGSASCLRPTSFALKKLTAAEEKKIRALVKKAVS